MLPHRTLARETPGHAASMVESWRGNDMDARTLAAYDAGAQSYCDEWLSQPPPTDLQALWKRFFVPGAATLDVGAGSGRDVDWLNRNGYPCSGIDASGALVDAARRLFAAWRFEHGSLPELAHVPAESYCNVVCETVIMHLPQRQVGAAVAALRRLLRPGGTLYLSWRVGSGEDLRDAAGRLYSAFPVETVRAELQGLEALYEAAETSASSGKRVQRLIVRRAHSHAR
jgi:SAM-dependent methyltransferase